MSGLFRNLWLANLAALTLAVPMAMAGQYHVCTDANGNKLFSETPCPKTYSNSEVREYQASGQNHEVDVKVLDPRLNEDNALYQEMKANNRRLELERKIVSAEKHLKQQSEAMQAELAPLVKTRNGLAGPNANNRRAAMDIEIQQVKDRYFDDMNRTSDSIKEMKAELQSLQK